MSDEFGEQYKKVFDAFYDWSRRGIMRREAIEKAVNRHNWDSMVQRDLVVAIVVERINAALDMAVFEIDQYYGIDPDGNSLGVQTDNDPFYIRKKILDLKLS